MQSNLGCDIFVLVSEGKLNVPSSVKWLISGQS